MGVGRVGVGAAVAEVGLGDFISMRVARRARVSATPRSRTSTWVPCGLPGRASPSRSASSDYSKTGGSTSRAGRPMSPKMARIPPGSRGQTGSARTPGRIGDGWPSGGRDRGLRGPRRWAALREKRGRCHVASSGRLTVANPLTARRDLACLALGQEPVSAYSERGLGSEMPT